MSEDGQNPVRDFAELDKLVHEPRRFACLNALNTAGALGSIYLQRITGLSQGNLMTHLRKLEDAGLVEIHKRPWLGRSYLRFYITQAGRDAVQSHWRKLHELEEELHGWQPSDEPEAYQSERELEHVFDDQQDGPVQER